MIHFVVFHFTHFEWSLKSAQLYIDMYPRCTTSSVMTPSQIKYHISTHMCTAFLNNLSLVTSPFKLSLSTCAQYNRWICYLMMQKGIKQKNEAYGYWAFCLILSMHVKVSVLIYLGRGTHACVIKLADNWRLAIISTNDDSSSIWLNTYEETSATFQCIAILLARKLIWKCCL